jgi:hypothetical protein
LFINPKCVEKCIEHLKDYFKEINIAVDDYDIKEILDNLEVAVKQGVKIGVDLS